MSTSTSASLVAASPSTTSTSINADPNNPGSFYKNLFYILIGLLCAFGLVSFLSLLRARQRRTAIIREAQRLGVVVPGMEGYVPMRERQLMTWAKSDGTDRPDWWDVGAVQWGKKGLLGETGGSETAAAPRGEKLPLLGLETPATDFCPLALVPPPLPTDASEPIPLSTIPYFPNHLAYRPSSLLPPPVRFKPEEPDTLDQLQGGTLDVVTIVKMPMPEPKGEPKEGEEVVGEWGGMELGIVRVGVVNGTGS